MNTRVVKEEIRSVVGDWPIWVMLATQDIKLRYRRSSIGPLWITLSMAISIYSLGFLYGYLFKAKIADYFPYLATGLIAWSTISMLLCEGVNVFIESESYIRNQESNMSIFVMRVFLRNLIILAHNLLVLIPVFFVFKMHISYRILFILPGLLMIGVNAVCWGTFLGIMGTRYRDFSQIVTSLVQVVFFLTPIMWMPDLLPARLQWGVVYNPFYQFVNLIRAPLLNQSPSLETYLIVMSVSVIGFLLYVYFLGKYRHRIVFWL